MNSSKDGLRIGIYLRPDFAAYTFLESTAKINADGTITPVWDNDWCVFVEYDSYTVERLAEFVYFTNTWHEEVFTIKTRF